ncbi:hypothetical protein GPECTOR_23g96 [Gonium pectorale]|uniref:ACB domain-containing protein n=1 Tax=Gonium pectorale TaxID=33097 RepID=A0A150GII0_GONPE|nr:hypothetical protein GPECTOR_23g96 [Gonium pectorale]|eukprot:KXZ49170.1 hypothetical protein GPECTOR_23g96 [Gonium pectorale]
MSKADAMRQYAELLQRVAPEWNQAEVGTSQPKSRGGMGPVFSCLAAGEDADAGQEAVGPRTLHEVAGEGDVEALTGMLEGGAQVDGRDEDGCTPLHFAADRGSVAAAQALIAAGAHLDAQDADGQTPLHYAAITENREVYDLLVAAGADVSVRDKQGSTAAEAAPASWGLG